MMSVQERNRAGGRAYPSAAAALVLLGAALRLYNLGVPSMWTDEMLVLLNASQSLSYIVDLSTNVEVHPPYFYFFHKALLAFGSGDFWLRLPSALFGTLTLYAVWRAGERHLGSRFAALAALGALAVHPLHIWVSRQVRPYALIVLCAALGVDFLLRYLRGGRAKDAVFSLLAGLVVTTVHYLGVFLLAGQWLCAAVSSVTGKVPRLGSVAGYGAGAALCFAPSAYFFWEAKFHRHAAAISAGNGFFPALGKIASALDGVFAFGAPFPFAWLVLAAAALFGAARLAAQRRTAAFLAVYALFTPAALLGLQYDSHLYAQHLSFLLPPVVLLAGAGFAAALPARARRPWTALAACLCLAGAFLALHAGEYYGPKGVVATWWNRGAYKDLNQTLQRNFPPGDMVVFEDVLLYRGAQWYAEHQREGEGPIARTLTPDQPTVKVVFLTSFDNFDTYFSGIDEFKRLFGDSATVARRDAMRLYQGFVFRQPGLKLDNDRAALRLGAAPRDVFAHAWSMSGLGVGRHNGCWFLFPERPRREGEAVFRISSESSMQQRELFLTVDGVLDAPGNHLAVEYRLDDGPWRPLVAENRPTTRTLAARFTPDGPYAHLWLRVRLRADEVTPTADYGGLQQAKFYRLTLSCEPPKAYFGSMSLPLVVRGLGEKEPMGDEYLQWGGGGSTVLEYALDRAGPLTLRYGLVNRIPGQHIDVLQDGVPVFRHENVAVGPLVSNDLTLEGRAGPGRIEIRCSGWNHKDPASTFSPGDPRDLSVAFLNLSLESAR